MHFVILLTMFISELHVVLLLLFFGAMASLTWIASVVKNVCSWVYACIYYRGLGLLPQCFYDILIQFMIQFRFSPTAT
jgi:hypothetical protein